MATLEKDAWQADEIIIINRGRYKIVAFYAHTVAFVYTLIEHKQNEISIKFLLTP